MKNTNLNQNNYNRRNNVEISGISNEVSDQNLEETVIGICKDSAIEVNSLYIEGCHRLPLGRNVTNTNKRVIVKFVNRKHSEAMLQRKKDIIKKSKVFVSLRYVPIISLYGGVQKTTEKRPG